MVKKTWLAIAVALLAVAAHAADDQAYWGVFAETSVTKQAGMPDMSEQFKHMPPEALKQMPPEVLAMIKGGPQRHLQIRVWSPGDAPANATASVAPPAGLKQGPRLDLEVQRPKPEHGEGGMVGPDGQPTEYKFTIKRYWGSSPTVKPGQPEVTTWDSKSLTPEQRSQMRRMRGGAWDYKPGYTTAAWPTKQQPGVIAPDALLTGHWALTTNYTGNATVDAPDTVGFLDPIAFSSPDLSQRPDLTQAMAFQWAQIANALGYHAQVMGMIGKDTLILWSSSEVKEDAGQMWDYLEMADVQKFVNAKQMMPGDCTAATVPAGIFQDCDMVSMQMVGYGPGAANTGQPVPRIQTKTTFMGTLGGKMMANMGRGGRGGRPNPPPAEGDNND